jgi:diacylglycerol kinase family enzyme
VAARFNERRGGRRGFWPYLLIGARTSVRYRARTYTLRVDGQARQEPALLVVCANGRQYGGGAIIAPAARVDDGRLDLVVVAPRSALGALWGARHLFRGTLDRVAGVRVERAAVVEIEGPEPLRFHVDGEVVTGGAQVTVRVRPAILRVRAP